MAIVAARRFAAEASAMRIYRDAPELGGYEIADTSVEVIATMAVADCAG
jgi:hypothetical protein